jgi:CheY-like chemotaxis protein
VTETGIRVALADDDVLLREGLASLLEQSGFVVVGRCGDGSQLIALVREHEPELAIVDIRMPPDHATEGLDAARMIRAEYPGIAILVLSAHAVVEHAVDLLTSGERSGCLLKSRVTDVDEFIETLVLLPVCVLLGFTGLTALADWHAASQLQDFRAATRLSFATAGVAGQLATERTALRTPAGIAVRNVRDGILARPRTTVAHTTLGEWLDATGTRIGGLSQLESGTARDLATTAAQDLHAARAGGLRNLGLLLAVLSVVTALGLVLRRSITRPLSEVSGLRQELARLARGTAEILEELREMSRGIHPATLSLGGLGPALKALTRRSTVPVKLDVRVQARLPEQAEVAAYFVVSEALANVAKHARASVVEVLAEVQDGVLAVSISDDGVGGADPSHGSGLIGLTDRVQASGARSASPATPEPGRGSPPSFRSAPACARRKADR